MALIDKDARNILVGVGVGLGVSALLPVLGAIFKDAGRPLAKASIKTGLVTFEKGREKMAHWGEVFEDLVAEAKAELAAESEQAPSAVSAPEVKVNGGV
jgi:hypothetical protein